VWNSRVAARASRELRVTPVSIQVVVLKPFAVEGASLAAEFGLLRKILSGITQKKFFLFDPIANFR
jgi:hypothetical protein